MKDYSRKILNVPPGVLIVLEFDAVWFSKCRATVPKLAEWSENFTTDNVKFYEIDADDSRDAAEEL